MTDNQRSRDGTTGLQVACDTAVSGCVFRMRTDEGDRQRLLEVTREHVEERHGTEISLDEIDERYVESVDVPLEEATR